MPGPGAVAVELRDGRATRAGVGTRVAVALGCRRDCGVATLGVRGFRIVGASGRVKVGVAARRRDWGVITTGVRAGRIVGDAAG